VIQNKFFWAYVLVVLTMLVIFCTTARAANTNGDYIGNAADAKSTDLLDFPYSWTAVDGEYLLISGSSVTTQALGTAAQSAVADFIAARLIRKRSLMLG